MKEMEMFLKTVSDGLKILAQGVKVIADKLESFAEQSGGDAARSPVRPVPVRETGDAPPAKRGPRKAEKEPGSQGTKGATASDRVYAAISRETGPVGIDLLAEKTGFDKKKLYNVLLRLKKQGKIENVNRGVYRKVS